MADMKMPLEGVKVVEMATVVAAPTTARVLSTYGADVIKVETLGGDVMRVAGTHELTPYTDECNPLFTIHNTGKKFISINFKTPEGKKILLDLIKDADVFITNVREKSMIRNGLDYDTLKEINPGLIYAQFTGYGNKGPAANDPGFDITAFWLRGGAMADWETEGAFPMVPTYAFGDMVTSNAFLAGIMMALFARTQTGRGTKIDTSLLASGVWCNAIGVVQTQFDRKHLNPDPLTPPDPFSQTYICADNRWIGIYCNEYEADKAKFAKLLDCEDILDDPRYENIETMHSSGAIREITARLNEVFKTKTSQQWRQFFSENNVAAEIMQQSCEVSSDPQAIANEYMVPVEYNDEDHTTVMMPNPPIMFSDYDRRENVPTGSIGEDTDTILESMGYSEAEIQKLKDEGAIG